MRRRSMLLASLAALVLLACTADGSTGSLGGADAAAQHASQQLSPYLLPADALSGGFSASAGQTWSNAALAGALQDPEPIHQLVTSGHVVQLRQTLTPGDSQSPSITLFLDLYLAADGAAGAIRDPWVAPGTSVEQQPAPGLGAAGSSTRITDTNDAGAVQEEETVGAASGRVAARVSEAGPPGSTQREPLLALLTRVIATVTRRPPAAPSKAERTLVAEQTTPRAILRDSYAFLVTNFVTQPNPATLLNHALSGAAAAGRSATPQPLSASDPNSAWTRFAASYDRLAARTTEKQALAYAAITAMYDAQKNCHTAFYPPDRYARLLTQRRGDDYARIGVSLTVHIPLVVLRVSPGSPADQAGVRTGDRMLALDHQTPEAVGESAFGMLLAGAAGSTVLLTVVHPGATQPVDIPVVRAVLPQEIERHERLASDIGYIELGSFPNGDVGVERMRAAIQELQAAGPLRGWILDLRLNEGGSETAMQRIAGLFLSEGTPLVTITTRDGSVRHLASVGTPLVGDGPLAILVGPATASSAEMLTEAFRQLGRATVVGTRTGGCVNGGEIVGLLDGSGLLLSTQQVRVGRQQEALEGVGIAPDLPVEFDLAAIAEGRDTQLDAALGLLTALGSRP